MMKRREMMAEKDTSDLTGFMKAMQAASARQILQLGAVDKAFVLAVLEQQQSPEPLHLHCVASHDLTEAAKFDSLISDIDIGDDIEITLTKHLGSETEINDEVLSIAEVSPFDAIFISGSSSAEALLTALMVGNESLKSGGILGVARRLIDDRAMETAISSFLEMYGDIYDQPGGELLVKK